MALAACREAEADQEIDEMRKQHLAEEHKKREKAAPDTLKGLIGKMLSVKKRSLRSLFCSYDLRGNPVGVRALGNLPRLVASVSARTLATPDKDPRDTRYRRFLAAQPDLVQQLRDSSGSKTTRIVDEPKQVFAKSTYNAIVPRTGVTFVERGREPKVHPGGALTERKGRLSRTEYYAMINSQSGELELPQVPPTRNNVEPLRMVQRTFEPDWWRRKTEEGDKSQQSDLSELLLVPQAECAVSPRQKQKPHLPPSYLGRSKSAIRKCVLSNAPAAEPADFLHLNPDEGMMLARQTMGPMVRGRKPTARVLRESIGMEVCVLKR